MTGRPKLIFLVGFMGCGKSTLGKKLASALGWQFIDLDKLIEGNYSKTIDEIFMLSGEGTFRRYESEVLHNLNLEKDTVISVGGGAPCFFGNMEFMKRNGKVVYLRMTPSMLKERLLADNKPRPLLKGLREDELEKFIGLRLVDREPFYLQANHVEEGSDPDIRILAENMMKMFGDRGK